jgi:hypothetical protein
VGERRQKTLNSAIKWSLTAFLMVLVVWVAGEEVKRALVARERAEQERQWAASWEATKQEYLWPWPESDLAASSAAKQKVQWEIAANLARQADGITGMEERRWSQVDKINIALANYYLGNWTGYQKWLEAAKAMDPNEPMLQIN